MVRFIVLVSLCLITPAGCSRQGSQSGSGLGKQEWTTEIPGRVRLPLGIDIEPTRLETLTPSRLRLGRSLFFDRRLSADGTVACASCHRPEHGFSEQTSVSSGIRG